MTTQDLKACPFCDSKDVGLVSYVAGLRYSFGCFECDFTIKTFSSKEEAIAAWTTRPRPDVGEGRIPHRCPTCGGMRTIQNPNFGAMSTAIQLISCPTCNGEGVLWSPPDAGEEVREGLGQTIDAIERRMEQCSTMENGKLARRMLAEVRDFAMSRLSKQEGNPEERP